MQRELGLKSPGWGTRARASFDRSRKRRGYANCAAACLAVLLATVALCLGAGLEIQVLPAFLYQKPREGMIDKSPGEGGQEEGRVEKEEEGGGRRIDELSPFPLQTCFLLGALGVYVAFNEFIRVRGHVDVNQELAAKVPPASSLPPPVWCLASVPEPLIASCSPFSSPLRCFPPRVILQHRHVPLGPPPQGLSTRPSLSGDASRPPSCLAPCR